MCVNNTSHIKQYFVYVLWWRILQQKIATRVILHKPDVKCLSVLCFFPGGVSELEMLRTFNCGIGLALITSKDNSDTVLDTIPEASIIGTVATRSIKGMYI